MTDIAIPGYEIHETLGTGEIATVYHARHLNLNRDVAIKVMDPLLGSDPTFSESFKREARISAGLKHPHIVQVYDVDSLDGVNYLVMEYIGDGDLYDVIRGPLQLNRVYDVIRQITSALDYAHSKGCVHQDIKPGNILIRDDGTCALADFGIAKAAESNTHMTVTGNVVSTPSYISPEQAQGLPLDGRSDIYSLAIVCYEMITKDLPYKSESPISTALKHLLDPIPELPPALAQFQSFFNKALAKDRDERFQTGAEMAAALESLLEEPVAPAATAGSDEEAPHMPTPSTTDHQHEAVKPVDKATAPPAETPFSRETPVTQASASDQTPAPAESAALNDGDGVGVGDKTTTLQSPNSDKHSPSSDEDSPNAASPVTTTPSLEQSTGSQPPPVPQQRPAPEPIASQKRGPRFPLWLMAGIAVVAGAGTAAWFALQEQPSGGAPDAKASVAPVPTTHSQESEKVDALLEKARAAADAGQLFEPRGNSAFDFYQKARALDPDNPSVAAGLDLLLVTTVENAKRNIADGEVETAQQALGNAAMIDPSDIYLRSAEQELAKAVKAKMEASEQGQQSQQPDSDPVPQEATSNSMDPASEASKRQPGTAPINSSPAAAKPVETETLTGSAQALLSQARSDLRLNTADSRDAALMALQQVQKLEPANKDVESMLETLLNQYLEVARIETDKGNFQSARRAMDSARRIDPEAQLGPGGVAELLATGKGYEQEGAYKAAVKTYLEALIIEPENPEIDARLHGVHQLYISAIQQHLADREMEKAAELQAEALTWFPNSEALKELIASP